MSLERHEGDQLMTSFSFWGELTLQTETPKNAYSIRLGAKNNRPRLFSANSSPRVFSKSWQYYFNGKRRFALVQADSKICPKSAKLQAPYKL